MSQLLVDSWILWVFQYIQVVYNCRVRAGPLLHFTANLQVVSRVRASPLSLHFTANLHCHRRSPLQFTANSQLIYRVRTGSLLQFTANLQGQSWPPFALYSYLLMCRVKAGLLLHFSANPQLMYIVRTGLFLQFTANLHGQSRPPFATYS